jgi:hypothetical protein
LNYANGYEDATELSSIHKKSGTKKKYTVDSGKRKGKVIYFTNPSNKTSFGLNSLEESDTLPKSITVTIFYPGKQENFVVYKQ